jgi:DNA polymerase III alpha subunit (gram-positive type)
MKAVIFDTETTGLVKNRTIKLDNQPEIIEFYGALVDLGKKGKILKEVDTLIKPNKALSMEPNPGDKRTITQITGIDNEMLKSAPIFAAVSKEIFQLLEKAPLIIAHNLSFDKDMVEIEAQRLKKKVKWPRGICTVEQTISLLGYRLTLSKLYEHLFEEKFEGAHRAKADVEALIKVCVELHKRNVI